MSLLARLEQRSMPEPNSGCILWFGALSTTGYGSVWDESSKKSVRAHRASYEVHRGPVPDGLFVLHKCDTPPCVNPDHLFLGTQSDNLIDAYEKGRLVSRIGAAGLECKRGHRLTPDNVSTSRTTGWRKCRRCKLDGNNAWKRRLRERTA